MVWGLCACRPTKSAPFSLRESGLGFSRNPICSMLLEDHQSLPSSHPARRIVWMRRLWHLAVVMSALALFSALVWVDYPLLQDAASLWIVSDAVSPADAAVVLGGSLDVRPFAAAELYQQGLVKKVLVSKVSDDRTVAIGVEPPHTEANRQVLLKLGVPATAIETFGIANKNTKDEAIALRAWVERHHLSSVIIPTDIFSARRVRWMFDREFSGQQIQIEVLSFDPPTYTRANWWRNDNGIVAFQNEILKYIYYRLKN